MTLIAQHARRAPHHTAWRRLWAARGLEVEGDDAGFVAEPRTGRFLIPTNVHLRTLDQWDDVPCLLALGEPGLGKSWEVGAYCARLAERTAPRRRADADGDGPSDAREALLTFDCAQVDVLAALETRVFGSDTVVRWRDGAGVLHLVMDSLDESRVPVDTLCSAVLDAIELLPVDRLRLRIACRTAVLPAPFRDGLRQKFATAYPALAQAAAERDSATAAHARRRASGPQAGPGALVADDDDQSGDGARQAPPAPFAEVELTALTRADARVRAAARLGSPDRADQFLDAVGAADAGAFAARPQTLDALLDRYESGATLAASQVELYRTLCARLCTPKPIRPGTSNQAAPRTSAAQRYRLAARICAAMLFGNRPAIWLGEPGRPGRTRWSWGR